MIVEKYQNHHLLKFSTSCTQLFKPTSKPVFPDVSNILVTVAPDCVKVVKSISLYLFKTALASKPDFALLATLVQS
jgi:hypothetical protein